MHGLRCGLFLPMSRGLSVSLSVSVLVMTVSSLRCSLVHGLVGAQGIWAQITAQKAALLEHTWSCPGLPTVDMLTLIHEGAHMWQCDHSVPSTQLIVWWHRYKPELAASLSWGNTTEVNTCIFSVILMWKGKQVVKLLQENAPFNNCRPAKSHASRMRLMHFWWVSGCHSAQWKSHAFSCSTKNYIFNVTSVLLLWWEMRVLTPVLLLLTLGLLISMCGSIRHTAQWQCPGSKLVHSKWLFGSTTRM